MSHAEDMAGRTTWSEKVDGPGASVVKALDRPYAGHAVGDLMLISSPVEIDRRIRRLKSGTAITAAEFRQRLADREGADFACPMTTGIFLRIVAEAALEQIAAGAPFENVTPFWRVIEPESALARKVSCGPAFIAGRRRAERSAH